MDSLEKKLRDFGFTRETDPEVLARWEKENEEMIKKVIPVWRKLDAWTKRSSGKKLIRC